MSRILVGVKRVIDYAVKVRIFAIIISKKSLHNRNIDKEFRC